MARQAAGYHHALVRAARSLHLKKHREALRCFLVEGPTAVGAALGAHGAGLVERIFLTRAAAGGAEMERVAARAGVPVFEVDERTMQSLAQTRSPQGVVAVARFFDQDADSLAALVGSGLGPCLVVVLHEIADPGNAGTLIRSAEAFGASAVCLGPGAVDPYNDKVVRASMGSLFHIPLLSYKDWGGLARAARSVGLTVVAAEAGAPDVRSVTLPARAALVVGHERKGLAGIPAGDIGLRVGIPQALRAESLNAGVAGSIVMYELARASGVLPASATRTSLT